MPYFPEIIIILVLVLIALNGIFAMSEFALVSAKKTRLRQKAEEGDTGADTALKLANEPHRFSLDNPDRNYTGGYLCRCIRWSNNSRRTVQLSSRNPCPGSVQ